MTDEHIIIKELAKGSDFALKQLYDRYHVNVYNISISYTQNAEDAEEVTQDVFLKVYDAAKKFRFDAAVSSWIYRITVNKSLDFLRKKNTKKRKAFFISLYRKDTVEELPHTTNFVHPGLVLENKEKGVFLFKALAKLPEKQKTAFILREIEGLPYQEIADIMSISTKAVESVLYRSKANLRKALAPYYRR